LLIGDGFFFVIEALLELFDRDAPVVVGVDLFVDGPQFLDFLFRKFGGDEVSRDLF
jgi:hypothetical protein